MSIVVCDECEDIMECDDVTDANFGNPLLFETEKDARKAAKSAGWRVNSECLCPNCVGDEGDE